MNFQVLCFDVADDELIIAQEKYLDTLVEAIQFANSEGRFWVGGTTIVPLNEWAEKQMKNNN